MFSFKVVFLLSQNVSRRSQQPPLVCPIPITTSNITDVQQQNREAKTVEQLKASVSVTYCEVFCSSRRRAMPQIMNYSTGWRWIYVITKIENIYYIQPLLGCFAWHNNLRFKNLIIRTTYVPKFEVVHILMLNQRPSLFLKNAVF